ncbi:MAG: ABC transporter substrate-binding protein [Lachnospiraceae bacterium]|nr:ABC transporter substrate-binding protein [Lachnospiraceae bacterium]
MKIRCLIRTALTAALGAALLGSFAFAADIPEVGVAAETSEASGEETGQKKDYEQLTVGSTTALTGAFFTDMWGNGAADLDVRTLLHGYDLIRWNAADGIFEADPSVISGVVATEDSSGNRTFTISLYSDMKYSDGTQIGAADYAFAILLTASPEVEQIGGRIGKSSFILGYDAYLSGEKKAFEGVRILGERELAVTIRADYLPYFYELGLLNFSPAPISVIAPGCTVKDDGEGAYISSEGAAEPFSAQLLQKTILDGQIGYLSHPSVVSGPYVLTSFDGSEASFEINPMYKGDSKGNRPSIEKIRYVLADNETMMDELQSGRIGLLNRVSAAGSVQQGIALVNGKDGGFAMSSYPRSGMSFISFCGETAAGGSNPVRQAVAYCLDREEVTKGYEGTLGVAMNCYSGLGQWMYQADPEEYGQSLEGIRTYGADEDMEENISAAAKLLEADGWTLNEAGDAFDAAADPVRYKKTDAGLVRLSMTLLYPEGSRIGELLGEHLADHAAQAGMEIILQGEDMGSLLARYYGREERTCDMMYLATNFDMVFDPAEDFTEENGQMCWKNTHIPADELEKLAVDMRRTRPGDLESYYGKWVAFQEAFTTILPMIPVYSNVYFDFYTDALKGYEPSENITWPMGITGAALSDG